MYVYAWRTVVNDAIQSFIIVVIIVKVIIEFLILFGFFTGFRSRCRCRSGFCFVVTVTVLIVIAIITVICVASVVVGGNIIHSILSVILVHVEVATVASRLGWGIVFFTAVIIFIVSRRFLLGGVHGCIVQLFIVHGGGLFGGAGNGVLNGLSGIVHWVFKRRDSGLCIVLIHLLLPRHEHRHGENDHNRTGNDDSVEQRNAHGLLGGILRIGRQANGGCKGGGCVRDWRQGGGAICCRRACGRCRGGWRKACGLSRVGGGGWCVRDGRMGCWGVRGGCRCGRGNRRRTHGGRGVCRRGGLTRSRGWSWCLAGADDGVHQAIQEGRFCHANGGREERGARCRTEVRHSARTRRHVRCPHGFPHLDHRSHTIVRGVKRVLHRRPHAGLVNVVGQRHTRGRDGLRHVRTHKLVDDPGQGCSIHGGTLSWRHVKRHRETEPPGRQIVKDRPRDAKVANFTNVGRDVSTNVRIECRALARQGHQRKVGTRTEARHINDE
eukprot:m.166065 g.166065  ORF g.166065 m.166065 type:complete len:495 (-) comp12643_c0_seq1:1012-2496(-)